MESEKVKEIKKALECMSGVCKDSLTDICFNCEVGKKFNDETACKEALTLINEFESENETIKFNMQETEKASFNINQMNGNLVLENQQLKTENERLKEYRKNHSKTLARIRSENTELKDENERLLESCKNCHYIKDLEIANGHAKELKDRIAELEKELKEEKMCSFNRSTIITLNEKELEILKEENERLANSITCQVVLPDDKLEEIKKECLEKVELAKSELLKQFTEMLKEKGLAGKLKGTKDIEETLKEFINKGAIKNETSKT